jgi:hypothetical protein
MFPYAPSHFVGCNRGRAKCWLDRVGRAVDLCARGGVESPRQGGSARCSSAVDLSAACNIVGLFLLF